ncbi:MAG: hypothetical protein CFE26_23025, partial [Verrucomicrobiales bacterium VVV1]
MPFFGAVLALENSIVAGNTAPSAANGPDIHNDGTVNATGAHHVQAAIAGTGTVPGSATIGTAAPRRSPLGNYGGPTQTRALLPTSPARNAAVGSPAPTAQRGLPIIGTADIGAYEAGNQLATIYIAYIWESLPTAGNGLITDPLHAST